jgi:hypothetical protein
MDAIVHEQHVCLDQLKSLCQVVVDCVPNLKQIVGLQADPRDNVLVHGICQGKQADLTEIRSLSRLRVHGTRNHQQVGLSQDNGRDLMGVEGVCEGQGARLQEI